MCGPSDIADEVSAVLASSSEQVRDQEHNRASSCPGEDQIKELLEHKRESGCTRTLTGLNFQINSVL